MQQPSPFQDTDLEEATCPLGCSRDGEDFLFAAPHDRTGELFQVVRCRACRTVFLNPRPTRTALLRFYERDYYGADQKKFDPATEAAIGWFVSWRAQVLKKDLPPGGTLLDVGCGRGNFLEAMAARGFDVYGTELSPLSAQRASRLFGERIFVGDVTELARPDNHFDLVSLWHVLEHLRDPRGVLGRIHQLLKPQGRVVLAQPNIDSWQAQVGGPVWFHLDIPRHLYHFSPATLTLLLDRVGFQVQRVSHFSVEQNPYGLTQTILNRLGLGQNRLYHILKGETVYRQGSIRGMAFLLAHYLMMPVAMALSSIESLLGRGGTFYLVAEKKRA